MKFMCYSCLAYNIISYLHYNDIPNSITNMLRLYADDALLYSIINSTADCINSRSDLLTLQKWCKTWQMEFNPTKCEHLQITNKYNFIDTHYTLYEDTIQKVTIAKYLYPLGITFDCHLNWKNHINIIAAKANAAQAFLRRNTTFCPTEVKIHLYNTFVYCLVTTYCSYNTWLNLRKFTRYIFND